MKINDFSQIVANELGIDPSLVTPDANLSDDLGVDSLSLVNIVVEVEQRMGCELVNLDFEEIETLEDAYQLLVKRKSEAN